MDTKVIWSYIWKPANTNVYPIFKKGKRLHAINERPVSLVYIQCILIEHFMTSSIMPHTDKLFQPGFDRGLSFWLSFVTQLKKFMDDVSKHPDEGKQIECLVIDFSKVLDEVNHPSVRIRRLINGLRTFFKVGQHVVVERETSNSVPVASGLSKWTVKGNSLFLFYINNIPLGLSLIMRLFADGTIVYLAICSVSDCQRHQEDIGKLAV